MVNKALSLIEMVIGLAITAVLASTALLSFNFVDSRKLDTQARNLVSDLTWIRELAASQHKNYTVTFDIINETYLVYNGTVSAANLTKKSKLTVNLVNVTNWTNSAITQLIFSAPRGNTSTSALINLNQTGYSRRLNITNETGFVRME